MLFHFCTRDCGCNAHPAFPAPSLLEGSCWQSSGASRREKAEVCVLSRAVIACDKRDAFAHRSESDEAIQLRILRHDGLLRCARNDGLSSEVHGCLKFHACHGRACPGHPRPTLRWSRTNRSKPFGRPLRMKTNARSSCRIGQDVDGRDKPGHDEYGSSLYPARAAFLR